MKILGFLQIATLKATLIFDALVPKWSPDFLWCYRTIWADIRKYYNYVRTKTLAAFAFFSAIQAGAEKRAADKKTLISTVNEKAGYAILRR